MRAVVCKSYSGFKGAEYANFPTPELLPGTVRIKVFACSASFASLLVMEGKHQNRAPLPLVPGTELAGEVLEVADDVRQFRPGDRVVAGVSSGAYAEQVVAPVQTVFHLPAEISFEIGAQFPTIYGTAWGAFKWRARVQPGETVLVHGAAGGSGFAALQVARALEARVIAVVGSEDKVDFLKAHGFDEVINYKTNDFRTEVLKLTNQRGADVIFDPVGGAVLDNSLRCIAPEGRLIVIGFASGVIPKIPANIVLVKNIDIVGMYWGFYFGWGRSGSLPTDDVRLRSSFAEMFELVKKNKLTPHTHDVFPLSEFKEALQVLESRKALGRVIMCPF